MRKVLFILFNLYVINSFSQNNNPVIPFEIFFGNNRINNQINVNKNIKGKFFFQNISTAAVDYKNTLIENEVIMMNSLNYQFHKHINIGTGLRYHYLKGIIPNLSMSFTYFNPTWTFILSPCLELLPKRNLEFASIIEFKPKLTENIRLYSRIQGLYNQNLIDNLHDRSFLNFRLGLKINNIMFGAATNLDNYGPHKFYKDNYGVFFRIEI
ncbi:MAG: hypothetical protein ACK5MH_02865 [Bacteroidales bacterium]